jgi:hypothetical protein
VAIVLLVIAFGAGAAGYCSKADAQEGLSISFGAGMAGSERCFESMLLAQEMADRKWLAYLSTHGPSGGCRDPAEPVAANIGAGIIRTTHLGKWSVGFGAGVMEHGDVVVGPWSIRDNPGPRSDEDIQFVAAILIRRTLGKRLVFDLLHNSTGGSTHFNRGLNSFTFGMRF